MEGRKLIEYSFQVPQSESHYRVRMTDGEWLPAAYSGVVLVDAATAEPVGLAVQTDELPPATGSCQTFATLNYSRVRIGGNDLLLPSKAVQRFISRDGQETENTTTFSSCREYSSESSVNFYTGPEDAVKDSRRAVAPQRIPAGLRFRMQLTADIDMETAAAGDPFAAKITSTVRDRKGHVQLPKGALIAGHICLLQLRYRPEREAVLGLSAETLDIGAASVPIAALLDSRAFAGQRAHDKNRGVEIMLPPPGQYAGIFRFSGEHIIFRRGFTSEWVTALPRNAR
jgi:hypothetical protein